MTPSKSKTAPRSTRFMSSFWIERDQAKSPGPPCKRPAFQCPVENHECSTPPFGQPTEAARESPGRPDSSLELHQVTQVKLPLARRTPGFRWASAVFRQNRGPRRDHLLERCRTWMDLPPHIPR